MLLATLVLMAGCDQLEGLVSIPTTNTPEISATLPTPISATSLPTLTMEASALVPMVVWVPPQFDPGLDNEASQLLFERLEAFQEDHPNLVLSIRVKSETGPAGLVDALRTTSKVAPQVLPDLVLLPYGEMQNAVARSLVYPYASPVLSEDDPDWFPLAAELSTYQQNTYSLPMAANTLVMAYNSGLIQEVPTNWDELLRSGYLMTFPAGDPKALLTTAFYLAEGGQVRNATQSAALATEPLTAVLGYYSQAMIENLLPANSAQITSDLAAWELFAAGSRQIAFTWFDRYLALTDPVFDVQPLPTTDGEPFTMATGWGWVLTNPDPNKQVAAAELARFLTAPAFSGPWTEAANLLPLRPSALTYWENAAHRSAASEMLSFAAAFPDDSVQSEIGPALQQAVANVLSGTESVQEAAEGAVEQVGN
jgi:ABC-type glycerol-3-phosphate transport system substrate-binding protein